MKAALSLFLQLLLVRISTPLFVLLIFLILSVVQIASWFSEREEVPFPATGQAIPQIPGKHPSSEEDSLQRVFDARTKDLYKP